jgi:hypothetical protein
MESEQFKASLYSRTNKQTTVMEATSVGMKTVRIFSDRIRDRIRLEGF